MELRYSRKTLTKYKRGGLSTRRASQRRNRLKMIHSRHESHSESFCNLEITETKSYKKLAIIKLFVRMVTVSSTLALYQ